MSGADIQKIYDQRAEEERQKLKLLDAKSAAKKKQAVSEREKTRSATQGLIPNKRTHNTLQFADIFKSE